MLKDREQRIHDKLKHATRQLRQAATQVIFSCQQFVDRANNDVTIHTKAAIAAELGADAAEMLAMFNAAKSILVAHDGQDEGEITDVIN